MCVIADHRDASASHLDWVRGFINWPGFPIGPALKSFYPDESVGEWIMGLLTEAGWGLPSTVPGADQKG